MAKPATRQPVKRARAAAKKPCQTALPDFTPNAFLSQVTTMGLPGDDVAQSYMRFILFRITVILDRRRWRVGVLKEFYPRGQSLLGLNVEKGQEVCVRFRVPGNRDHFLPFHEVLCTTLHELAHCVHSRHDKPFWSLYYDLVRECEALEVRIVEQGLPLYPPHTPQLAASSSSSATATSSRPLADRHLITAEGTGHRLGGEASQPLPVTPEERRRLLAAVAAQRRMRAPPSSPPVAAPDASLPDDVPSTPPRERGEGWECSRCTFWNMSSSSDGCTMCGDADDEVGTSSQDASDGDAGEETPSTTEGAAPPTKVHREDSHGTPVGPTDLEWPCDCCTFLNSSCAIHCQMCGAVRVSAPVAESPPGPHLSSSSESVIVISDSDE